MQDQVKLAVTASESAPARIARNFAVYEQYLQKAQEAHARRRYALATAYAAVASHVVVQNHAGIFWSSRLERLLNDVGRHIGAPAPNLPVGGPNREFKRVLQVATQVSPIGGHTKMLCQWIDVDADRTHSLVLTQHRGDLPPFVTETVKRSGGIVRRLNHRPGGQLDWALELRRIAREHDLVILHCHCEDVVPLLAFADSETVPPILILNHADHLFWYGPSIAHLVINLRDAATQIAQTRRGIAEERNVLLPTLVEPIVRTRTREEARAALGIPMDKTMLLSVARRPKYRTMNGVTFADMHVPILQKFPDAVLYVVGVGDPEDWQSARDKVGGRIVTFAEQPDCKVYFEAADIYVDSFPFVSSTSMMEAAGYGLPLVTVFKYAPDARIFGINHVGLVGTAQVATSDAEYFDLLSRLISDPALRQHVGKLAHDAVAKQHTLPGWRETLESVYARAMALPHLDNRRLLQDAEDERPHIGELDKLHEDIFGGVHPVIRYVVSYMPMLPLRDRIPLWNELRKAGQFRNALDAAIYLLPEWIKRAAKDR
jgi:hypothetical protein